MSNKPVVKFDNIIGWIDRGDRGIRAELSGIRKHPRLGNPTRVTTSLIEKIEHESDTYRVTRIETLNTVYEREEHR